MNPYEHMQENLEGIRSHLDTLLSHLEEAKPKEIDMEELEAELKTILAMQTIKIDPVLENRVLTNVIAQTLKGVKKYKTLVEPNNHLARGWLNHLKQELVDGHVYTEALVTTLNKLLYHIQDCKELLFEDRHDELLEKLILLEEELSHHID